MLDSIDHHYSPLWAIVYITLDCEGKISTLGFGSAWHRSSYLYSSNITSLNEHSVIWMNKIPWIFYNRYCRGIGCEYLFVGEAGPLLKSLDLQPWPHLFKPVQDTRTLERMGWDRLW
jgi:hypothetical protein